jgi:hypothetical protein
LMAAFTPLLTSFKQAYMEPVVSKLHTKNIHLNSLQEDLK